MKKARILPIISLVFAAICAVSFAACKGEEETNLSAPSITLAADYSVSWESSEGATGYVVNVNGDDLKEQTDTTFAAIKSAGSYEIKVKAVNGEKQSEYSNAVSYVLYSIKLPSGEGYEAAGEKLVYGGKDYFFTVTLKSGYESCTPTVKANGTELNPAADGVTYTVKSVSANLNVTVEGVEKSTFEVTAPTGEGFIFNGAEKAVFGEDYVFTVAKAEGYENSTITVKVNGAVLNASEDGVTYTVKTVSEALIIIVEGAEKNVYKVTLPLSAAYTATGADSATHGEDYSFVLEIKPEYNAENLVVKANDETLTPEADGKTYVVKAVKSDITITVEGLEINVFSVTLSSGEGYLLEGAATVEQGATYRFTLTIEEAYDKSEITVKANGREIFAESDGVSYELANVTEDLSITVEGVEINTYEVRLPAGEGYTVTGESTQTVNHGDSVSFIVAATEATSLIRVTNGATKLAGDNGVYTIENVTEDIILSVKVFGITERIYASESWNLEGAEKSTSIEFICKAVNLNAEYVKTALAAGYTHLKFEARLTGGEGLALTHGGKWDKYWRATGKTATFRIDLNEFVSGEEYFGFNIECRNGDGEQVERDGTLAITSATLIKSEKTAGWTKSNTNVYCAEEDGYIVLDTLCAGAWANVLTDSAWWEKFANNPDTGNVGQRTVTITGQWLSIGSNHRGMIWGINGAVSAVGNTVTTEFVTEYMNDRTFNAGDKFYAGNEAEGVYKFKLNEFVSNRNSWGGFSYTYVRENSFNVSLPTEGKVVNVCTQEYINVGYTKVRVTAGEYTGGQLWVGNDDWGTPYCMNGLNSGATVELDLSIFTAEKPYLQIFCSGEATTASITYEFRK